LSLIIACYFYAALCAICIAKRQIRKKMDGKTKEVLMTIAITTLSVLLALKINEMLNRARLVPPMKADK
jgi:hypothetical protein